ncbi:MAG: 7-cyano-7-deazaguanine synthase QueC [Thermodesulfobacteriota bacterium]
MTDGKRAVVLVSGGLDSATTLAIACFKQFECYSLSFDYGQRHRFEITAARRIASALGVVSHQTIPVDLGAIGGSALTAGDMAVPKSRNENDRAADIPVTYVPARNTIFLSFALAWAEVLEAADIFIGVNAVDYSGYPDCRPEFISAYETMANLATKAAVEGQTTLRIQAPLLYLKKSEIIRKGHGLGVDFAMTHSCYDPPGDGLACGLCDSCRLRRKGFEDAGIADPTRYVDNA